MTFDSHCALIAVLRKAAELADGEATPEMQADLATCLRVALALLDGVPYDAEASENSAKPGFSLN